MFKILTKREKIILYATVGIVIFGIGFNFLFAPILTKNEELNKKININKIKLKKYLYLLSQKEYLEDRYNEFSENLKGSVTEGDTTVGILSELENLAKVSNIRIIDIRPQVPKSFALYKEVNIDLRTEGDMQGYIKFLYNIENSLLLLRIKRFQLDVKPNTPFLRGIFSISKLTVE